MSSPPETKERVLDAAEKLFASHGFAATSLRNITAEADANLAAVNYHFGTKEALIQAVFDRRLGPLNQERLARLDAIESGADPAPSLDSIVTAFIEPALRIGFDTRRGGVHFMRIVGHMMSNPTASIARMFYEQLQEVGSRFHDALRRALPHLDRDEVGCRMLFMVGTMGHTMAHARGLPEPFRTMFGPMDFDSILRQMVAYVVAGFRAPATRPNPEVSSEDRS